MQYLLQDLMKLPLAERLLIVEQLLCTMVHTDYEQEIKNLIETSLKH